MIGFILTHGTFQLCKWTSPATLYDFNTHSIVDIFICLILLCLCFMVFQID